MFSPQCKRNRAMNTADNMFVHNSISGRQITAPGRFISLSYLDNKKVQLPVTENLHRDNTT